MPRVTRDDVARLAGTSTAVVSYVVNNGPRPVAATTRQRVLAAIEQLGYRPDSVARAMASRRTNLIGLVLPDARQPFFAELAHQVERAAFARGRLVLIGNSDYADDRELHYVRAFLGMRVTGLVLVSQGPSKGAAQEIADADVRVVLMHRHPDTVGRDAVVLDDVHGAYLATRHLVRTHGLTRVACVGGPPNTPRVGDPVADHVAGWRRAMDEAGLAGDGLEHGAPFDRFGAYEVTRALLRREDRPQALFCSTDDQAIGALRAAASLGLSVPRDLAVVGFDDIAEAAVTNPPLTTVAGDRGGMARAAVELALEAGPAAGGAPQVRSFPVSLVVRRSCGC